MAKVASFSSNDSTDEGVGVSTSTTMISPSNSTGDMLLVSITVSKNSGTPETVSTPAGWTLHRTDLNIELRAYIFWRETTADNENVPDFTISGSGSEWCIGCLVMRGVDFVGGPFGNEAATTSGAAADPTAPSTTTTANNSAVIHILARERRAIQGIFNTTRPQLVRLFSESSGGGEGLDNNISICKDFEKTSGNSVGGFTWDSTSGGDNILYCLEVLTDGTNIPLYFNSFPIVSLDSANYSEITDNTWRDVFSSSGVDFTDGTALSELSYDAVTDVDPGTDQITIIGHGLTSGDVVRANQNGNTLPTGLTDGNYYFVEVVDVNTIKLRDANGVMAGDADYYYSGTADKATIDITADGTGTCKFSVEKTLVIDLDFDGDFNRPPSNNSCGNNYQGNGVTFTTPIDLTGTTIGTRYDSNNNSLGSWVVLLDSDGDYKTYKLSETGSQIKDEIAVVDPDNTDQAYEYQTFDKTSVKHIIYIVLRLTIHNRTSATKFFYLELSNYNSFQIVGGDSSYPTNWDDFYNEAQFFSTATTDKPSDTQFVCLQPIQIGGGHLVADNDVYFKGTEKSIAFPQLADGVTSFRFYLASLGLTMDCNAVSEISIKNTQWGASLPFTFTVDADRPAGAAVDCSSVQLIRGTATFQADDVVSSMTFVEGEGVTYNDCTMTNPTFSNIDRADGYIVLTITHNISGASFSADEASDYAIEIDTAGTYDFNNFSFTGFTTDVNVTASSGIVNINLTNGSDTPTYTSAGATVNITQNVTIQHDNIVDTSYVQIYNVTKAAQLDYSQVTGGGGYSYQVNLVSAAADEGDTIRFRASQQVTTTAKKGLQFSGILTAAGLDFTASGDQLDAGPYNQYATDGSTMTEFSWDGGNLEIDVNDADNTTEIQRLGAWYHYYITTEDGIQNLFGCIDWESINSIMIDQSICDIKLDNVKATPLLVTGGRIYRSDESTVIASTSNSIQIDYTPIYAIETGISGLTPAESAKLVSLGTPAQNATAVWDEVL